MSDLRIPIAYTGTRIESAPLQARVVNGSVTLRLSIALGSPPAATLKDIKITGVDLGPVLIDFLCQPGAVTGPMDLTGEASLRLDDPWRTVSGSGRLRIGPGRVTGKDVVNLVNEAAALADLASAVAGPERRGLRAAPLDFTSITATYTITGGVVKTDDLLYEGPDLRVAGAGTFGLADGRVDHGPDADAGPERGQGAGLRHHGITARRADRGPGSGRARNQEIPRQALPLNRAPPSLPASTSPTKNA